MSPATVLVVDDEDIIRSLMKRALVAAGYDAMLDRTGARRSTCWSAIGARWTWC